MLLVIFFIFFISGFCRMAGLWQLLVAAAAIFGSLLPYLTSGVGRLLHLPSAEAVSTRPNAQHRYNRRSH